jgi:hypothetical protein
MALPPLPSGATKELPPLPPGATKELPPLPKGATKEESGFYDKAKAFGKSAIEAIPGGAGTYGGMELGAGLGAMTGPFAPVAVPVLGLAGAIGGHYLGEKFGEGAGELIPEEAKKDIGFSKEQREAERKKNPTMSSLGTYAPDIAAAVQA